MVWLASVIDRAHMEHGGKHIDYLIQDPRLPEVQSNTYEGASLEACLRLMHYKQ